MASASAEEVIRGLSEEVGQDLRPILGDAFVESLSTHLEELVGTREVADPGFTRDIGQGGGGPVDTPDPPDQPDSPDEPDHGRPDRPEVELPSLYEVARDREIRDRAIAAIRDGPPSSTNEYYIDKINKGHDLCKANRTYCQ